MIAVRNPSLKNVSGQQCVSQMWLDMRIASWKYFALSGNSAYWYAREKVDFCKATD